MDRSNSSRRVVGLDDVLTAIRIRESGGRWTEVIEATGFNGATLRPYIAEYLGREVLGRPATEPGDRVDSPYAVVVPVELSTESIDAARRAGMAFYSIAKALGVGEAKVRGLASPSTRERRYVRRSGSVGAAIVATVRDYSASRGSVPVGPTATFEVEAPAPVESATKPRSTRASRRRK